MKTLYAIAPLAVVLSLVGTDGTRTAPLSGQPQAQQAQAPADSRTAARAALPSWPAPVRLGAAHTADRLPTMPIGQPFESRVRP
jgi:hypothetical protein